ncbi:hypothetical protein ACFPME_01810 [Rhodanobacter umsongensis]|uniref:Uncharacterized protein n=1 Tax=Rhodanobacter umsongensis TaxID=633153 RepID=A0ABW0JGQ8_9GAMM
MASGGKPRQPVAVARHSGMSGSTTRFPDSTLAVQAASAGHRIAIVSLALVADTLDAGLLVAPFAQAPGGEACRAGGAHDMEARPDIAALRA